MATFYIQLENKLLQISGDLTAENISKALGYVPVSPNVTNELSQRVDNITFDSLKDNPFLQDGSGELNIVDEAGNIIAKVNAEGIHSVDFIAGNHKLTDKIDSSALNGYAKESWVTAEITKAATEGKVDLTGYATEEWVANQNYLTEHQDISHLATKDEVTNIDFYNIKDNPIVNNGDGKLLFVDENGYIGLQLEENGLYVKDVIADGHTLSQKADKSELSKYATKDEVSDLVDMSVVTELQGKVDTLVGEDVDKSVRDIAVDVLTETLVSETATEAYDTLAEMSAWIKSHPEDAAAMNTAIQKNATDIDNLDVAYKAADAKVLTDAQEYTDNINFYTIKDNPIVDGEAGSITFVDETGYIGLKVTEDGIIAKDVVTPEHTLSSKADKSFVEDNYYNKSTVDKKITEAVTGGQVSLDGFATEQWVNEQGFLKEHQDISQKADKSELPTKTSDLTNDSGFITINEVPEVTVPTKTSELTNDSGFITIEDVPVLEIPEEYVTETELNDKGFLTEHQDISHLASKDDVYDSISNIDFYSIKNNPVINSETGKLLFVDESGNIGLQLEDSGLFVADVFAGSHVLSNKADKSEVPTSTSQLTNDSGYITKPVVDQAIASLVDSAPETLDTIGEIASALKNNADIVDVLNQSISTKQNTIEDLDAIRAGASLGATALQEIPEEYAKKDDIPSLDGYATQAWVNNKNYATEEDLSSIEFNSLQNNPIVEDSNGEFNLVDDLGNVGFKVNQEGLFVKDVIAGEHMLSNKADKTYIDDLGVTELNAILVDTDSVADDPIVPDYVTETELNTALSSKMDKVTLAKVATSGSYNDLSNKPTIPSAVTESTVSGWGFTKNTGTYSKPSGGIPKSDLASAVQTSLGKADTALQSYTEQYKGTVTGVKINGTTKNPSSGVVDLGTVITSHQDISGKQDKLVSGTNIKTINGTSILGSGNIVISGGGGSSSGSGAYSEVNHGTSDTTFALTPNTFHIWDEVSALTLTLGSETSGIANEYLFQFTSGATATSLTLPDDIKWANDSAPTIVENMIYQISVLKGLASVLEFKNAAALIDNLCTYDGSKTVTFQYPVDSDVTVSVAGETVQISKGEMSGSFFGVGEPMGKITGIVPPFDKTYNYVY